MHDRSPQAGAEFKNVGYTLIVDELTNWGVKSQPHYYLEVFIKMLLNGGV